ncbi:hypothetical protein FA15DRAFT_234557 [Coprinopsis marcescibilis]|uniref:HSF-type DNA-binding domain-containing protein n=1 Tax=Coprinopsis marcescibilis TaxID=230819 RepID=A0A5C3KFG6_COPMA|nr:hypothetical protein FA15DRAFT_234557 [Coprinopsis marcescibilis]
MEEDSPESHHTNTNSLNPSGQLKPGPQTHQHIHSNLQTFHPFPPPQYLQHQRYYTDINNNHASSTRNPSSAPTSSSPTLLVLPPQSQQQQQQQQTQSAAANWANAPVYSSVPQHHHPIAPAPTSTQLGKRTRKGSSTARRNSCLGPPPELEDSYGLQQQQQQQQGNNTGQPAKKQVKRERRESLSMDIGNANTNTNTNTNNTMGGSGAGPSSHHGHDDPMPSTSDFVKKLYKMLEDPAFQNVVSWGPQGDCFVVKDMNEFTKSILPRMFKHSNFASFVRQLNKYDFHKVKNTDDNQFGEQSWTFRHPDFHADRRDALENIKRKVPAQRKNTQQQQQQQAAAAAAVAAASLLSSSPTSFGAAAGFGAGFGGVGVGGGGGFAGEFSFYFCVKLLLESGLSLATCAFLATSVIVVSSD